MASLLGGCFAGSRNTRYAVNGAVLAGGVVVAMTPLRNECSPGETGLCSTANDATLAVGVAIAAIAVAALAHTHAANLDGAPEPSDEVIRLTHEAATAARLGYCDNTREIATRVATLDPTYRDHAFAADADIAKCLR